MLKAIALDDEPYALEVIKNLSVNIISIELIECFTNSFKAMAFLQQNSIDLLFLDINMPNVSGIEFLKSLANPPMVIFTTAYSEHAVQSFELEAIDYLLKPFSQARFFKACNKAYEQYQLRKILQFPVSNFNPIFVKSGYEEIRVDLQELLYVESLGNYVQFVLGKQKITSRMTMSELGSLLPASAFIRIHRSFFVAKNCISKMDKKSVWLNTIELPIGAAYFQDVKNLTR